MKPSADMAPAYTTRRGWRIAMMAAMMNVSSPSSVTRICARSLPLPGLTEPLLLPYKCLDCL